MKRHRFVEFLEEDNGKLSSSRLFSFMIIMSFIFNWVHDIIVIGNFKPDYLIIGLIFGLLGVKILNKKVEQTIDRK